MQPRIKGKKLSLMLLAGVLSCLVSTGCEDGGKKFRATLRGAAQDVGRKSVRPSASKDTDYGTQVESASSETAADNSDQQTDSAARLAPPNKFALSSCPEGAHLAGNAPPLGIAQWCERNNDAGKPRRHGPYQRWHNSGALKVRSQYIDGQQHGEEIEFYLSGSIKERAHYYQGELHGVYEKFDKHGNPTVPNNLPPRRKKRHL